MLYDHIFKTKSLITYIVCQHEILGVLGWF